MFLFETIRILNGKFFNLDLHEQRMSRSRLILFNDDEKILLRSSLNKTEYPAKGLYKCKVVYNAEGINSITFDKYKRRKIKWLELVNGDSIDYSHKYLDRSALDLLRKDNEKGDIIIIKDGLVTDTSFSNLAFYDGEKWVTPRKPLLWGTEASRLISLGMLNEIDIPPVELKNYRYVKLINAMNPFDETPALPFRTDELRLELL